MTQEARGPSQMTLLPEQCDRLARVSAQTGAAIGITQNGSVITVSTGSDTFRIDARGQDIPPSNQEKLC